MGLAEPGGLPARRAAQSILADVLHRRRPPNFEGILAELPSRDAGFARAIVNETLRRLGQLDALIRIYVSKVPPAHRAGATFEILLAASCEFLFLGVPPHAVVDAANRLAREDGNAVHFKPLINAVLRRLTGESGSLLVEQDEARLNTPDWLWQRWSSHYGEGLTRRIASAHLQPAPLDLVLKNPTERDRILPAGTRLFEDILRVSEPGRVSELPGFDGAWWVQDAAASLPVRLLGDASGKVVMDLCAAPGGKTMQLAARGAQVIAIDRDEGRLSRMNENLQRTGLGATLVHSDLRDFAPAAPCSLVLLDAPCSATGTIRRHPELPWIKNAADVTACAAASRELLESAANLTARRGTLVYSVCSLEPEEGEEQIGAFLTERTDFCRLPILPGEVFGLGEALSAAGDLRTLPCHLSDKGGMDGFFVARLRRNS